MSKPILEARGLSKNFNDKPVLKNINLSVDEGEVLVIIGPSGSGKSTLLRCLNGLEDIQAGELYFKGEKIENTEKQWQSLRPKIGMVFQKYDLFPNKTVMENCIRAPMIVQGREEAEVRSLVETYLDQVGLKDYADRYPRELSGGQQQRVAIVRCLAMRPEVVLLDEITAALDPEVVQDVLQVILDLAEEDITMVIVTHEIGFAKQVADRIIFLEDGEVVEDTAAEEFFEKPKTDRAIEFIQAVEFGSLI